MYKPNDSVGSYLPCASRDENSWGTLLAGGAKARTQKYGPLKVALGITGALYVNGGFAYALILKSHL